MIRGERVTLRPMTGADLEPLIDFFAVPEVADAWPGDNEAHLRAKLACADDAEGMVVELDGQLIGFVQYYEESDPGYRHAGMDIALHPDRCNQGLGTDALRALAHHLVHGLGHHRLVIDPRASNARAIASYRKVGFRDVGVMRRYERGNDGDWHDGLLMDLLAEELS
jgi:aminoglycoside 6'-N-acetyltransferase